MDTLIQDIRYGLRMLMARKTFTLVIALTLAVGIGANTAIFSVVNAILLRSLPYRDSGRLVTILHDGWNPVAPANFLDWQSQSNSFQSMSAAQVWGPNLAGESRAESIKALQMTANMFDLLGVNAQIGRTFDQGEDQPGKNHVAVISYGLWQRRFGGGRGVLDRKITLDGESYSIVGVMPPDFKFAPFWATNAELWAPLNLAARTADRGGQSLRVFARLKDGVTQAAAQSEMDAINRRLEDQYPATNKGLTVSVDSLHDKAVGNSRPALLVLLCAVGFVLLISCANVANLMLARSAGRRREMAVRAALGAGRRRIVRQVLTESLLLALLGGGLGLVFAGWGISALLSVAPANLPRTQSIGLDLPVLGFCLLLSLLTGLVFGLFPALQVSRVDLNSSLREGGRGGTEGKRQQFFRSALVVSEVALALILLLGGSLLFRSFIKLQSIDPGFRSDNLLTMELSFTGSDQNTDQRKTDFIRAVAERVSSLPGIKSASAINHLPIGGDVWGLSYVIDGRPEPAPGEKPNAIYRVIQPNYFSTMGARLMQGRDFDTHDVAESSGVVVINETFAQKSWPGEDALGKRITVSGEKTPREIVGILRDTKQQDLTRIARPEMYIPQSQTADARSMTLVSRTSSDPLKLVQAVQSQISDLDRNVSVGQVRTMDQVISVAIGPQRFNLFLLGLFATIAVVLALVGIYGVISYFVTERTQEIGIRMALGAKGRDVLSMFVKRGMMLTFVGVCLGLAGGFALTRLMESLLFGVSATDPITFALVACSLCFVALFASLIPALRAARVDPMVALRHE